MKLVASFQRKPLYFILLFSLIIRIAYLLIDYPLWWDSHVYVGIGKYIFSGGEIGIWESFRPLVHPLILGIFWKAGFDPIIIGKILDVAFSVLAIYFTYKIAEIVFNKKIAMLSSLLLSVTPIFLIHTGLILTEPLALTLGLAGIYVLVRYQHLFSVFGAGVFIALSFLTRFPQGIWFAVMVGALVIPRGKATLKLKTLAALMLGFTLPILPYLLFNYFRYGSPWDPLVAGSWIITTSTWLYDSGISYYFVHFFIFNAIYLFSFMYLYHYVRQREWFTMPKTIIVLIPIITILYYVYVPRKELRYIVTSVPFLAMMVSWAVTTIYLKLKNRPRPFISARFFAVFCLILVIIPIPGGVYFERPPAFETELTTVIENHNLTGLILSSDPAFVSFLDHQVVTLDGMEFAPTIYQQYKNKFELLFMNDCNLVCAPDDGVCQKQKEDLLRIMTSENQAVFSESIDSCTYTIYLPVKS